MTVDLYHGDGWEIREGRWQDSPLGEVDVIISDPPYDARTHKGGRRGIGWAGRSLHRKISEAAEKSFDPVDPGDFAPVLIALCKRWLIAFCAVEQLGRYQDILGDSYLRSGLWVKANPTPQFTGDRPGQWGEAIAVCHRKGRKRWSGGGKSLVFRAPTVGLNNHRGGGAGSRLHETEKPLEIMLRLVELFSEPGELVWDPYCGSGTTGVACIRLGRRFIGHEMQPHYAKIAAERLAAEGKGLTLADVRAGQQSLFDGKGGNYRDD
ncbi:MAG: site-specific DNA-methyltransferase [Gammaproteobacteria bacterium]|nr:site-specific DNA-methyltransferase [Gammaproteobacteria bacterium]